MPGISVRNGKEIIQIDDCHFDANNVLKSFRFLYRDNRGVIQEVTFLHNDGKDDQGTWARAFASGAVDLAAAVAGVILGSAAGPIGRFAGGVAGPASAKISGTDSIIANFIIPKVDRGYYDASTHKLNPDLNKIYYKNDMIY